MDFPTRFAQSHFNGARRFWQQVRIAQIRRTAVVQVCEGRQSLSGAPRGKKIEFGSAQMFMTEQSHQYIRPWVKYLPRFLAVQAIHAKVYFHAAKWGGCYIDVVAIKCAIVVAQIAAFHPFFACFNAECHLPKFARNVVGNLGHEGGAVVEILV